MAEKKKEKVVKKKVCETFDISSENKEEVKDFCGEEKVKANASPEQKKTQTKVLAGILIVCAAVIVVVLAIYFSAQYMKEFSVDGVSYTIVQEGDLILYQTKFPMTYQGKDAIYNIYFRNDPRDFKKNVEFNGTMNLKQNLVINSKAEINCDGDGMIAIANVGKLKDIFGVNVFADSNATCDSQDRYTYLEIVSGNQTKITQTGNTCYELAVSDCEILEGTERFLLEVFAQYWKDQQKSSE